MSITAARARLSAWSRSRRTAAELHALTDRQLRDVGLHRRDIDGIARALAARPAAPAPAVTGASVAAPLVARTA